LDFEQLPNRLLLIDFFLYNFRPAQLTEDQEKKFGELLSVFIKDHHFFCATHIHSAVKNSKKIIPQKEYSYLWIIKLKNGF